MKKVILAGILVAVLGAGFAGCTNDETMDNTSEPSTVTTTQPSTSMMDNLSTDVSKGITDVSKGVSSVGEDLSKGASKVGEGVSKALS